MDENDIKAAALSWIRRRSAGSGYPVVASEFRLNGTGIRADLAILDQNAFFGIEIKSEYDTLKRLASQMEGYARYFDYTYLIVADKHLSEATTVNTRNAIILTTSTLKSYPRIMPRGFDPISGSWLLHLLTAEEERKAVRSVNEDSSCSTPLAIDAARRHQFGNAFAKRYGETSKNFWNSVKNRRIKPDDLQTLSRFNELRRLRQLDVDQQTKHWAEWLSAIRSCA